jgi:plasmid stability protein
MDIVPDVAVMTIRDLDDDVRDKLRIRAAQNKRSMEAEVRAILTAAVESPAERSFVDALLDFGTQLREAGVDINDLLPARDPYEPRVSFD